MIQFSNRTLQDQWESGRLHEKLVAVVYAVASRMMEEYNCVMVITSMLREGDDGVHGYWRAVDIRVHNFREGEADELTSWINKVFRYNAGTKPTALHHDSGKGDHIHLQVTHSKKQWV